MANEYLRLHGKVHITAWQKQPDGTEKLIKDDTFDNLIVNVGKDTILKGIGGACLTGFGTTAGIGTGDSTTVAALGQTDLQAACNKAWKAIPTTCKVYVRPTLFVSVDFGYSCNNFTWNELGLADSQGACGDPANGALMIARQIDASPLVKDCTKRAIVEWQLTL